MKKSSFFFTMLFMNGFRFGLLLLAAVILIVIGALWVDVCLYIGLGVVALYVVICVGLPLRSLCTMKRLCAEDSEFGRMMADFAEDPQSFLADSMERFDGKKQLHGEDLLTLPDDELFEIVFFQNADLVGEAEDEELDQLSGPRKTVYILSTFDGEIQNGGLCQFFVNSSGTFAPYVAEALATVGAEEHRALFEEFVTKNSIDVADLDSFKVFSKRGFIKQTKRFDFDAFDDRYYELPPLQDHIVAYIKENIHAF